MTSQPMPDKRPIIVVRKRAAQHVHHGGAWKVAYADFVTAMMALFIVLWLMNSSDHMRKAIAGYFNDPRGSAERQGTDRNGAGEAVTMKRDDLHNLKQALERQIASKPALVKLKQQIQITITPEGLRIELIESRDGTFFDSGSATLNQNGRDMLALLAHQLGDVPNNVSVEGHTDARAYADEDGYGNWELSADRANAARRLMQRTGLRLGQISQVRGFADRQLRVPGDPLDPSNRRISVIVHYLTQNSMQEYAQNESAEPSEAAAPAAHASATVVQPSVVTGSTSASSAKPAASTAVKSSRSASFPTVAHVNAGSLAAGLRARIGRVLGKPGI
jgi:chemotaxis protein MotB